FWLAVVRLRLSQADPRRAVRASARSLRFALRSHDHAATAQALNNRAIGYTSLELFGSAIRDLRRSLRIRRAVADPLTVLRSTYNLARILQKADRPGEACSLFQDTLAASVRHADSETTALTLTSLAELYDNQGNPQLALIMSRRAVAIPVPLSTQ